MKMRSEKFEWTWTKRTIFFLVAAAGIGSIMATSLPRVNINLFEALPKAVCIEGSVDLKWETEGDRVSITQYPTPVKVLESLLDLPPNGSARAFVFSDTQFWLKAESRDGLSEDDESVTVVPPEGRGYTYEPWGQCENGFPEWRIVNPPSEWDGAALVTSVHSMVDETITVTHGSVSASIGPLGSATYPFTGQTMGGDWLLEPANIPEPVLRYCACLDNLAGAPNANSISVDCSLGKSEPAQLAITVEVTCG